MLPCCTLWPDLTHTFIQQIFIKRLLVQGTSGEGGLQPGLAHLLSPQLPAVGSRKAAQLLGGLPGPPERVQPPRSHPGDSSTPAQVSPWPCPPLALPPPAGAGRYAQRAQPHLVGFSTSSAKEVPSLHSKASFLRFSRRPWQQPWPGHEPRHSTHDSGRVVWQMA